jgi:hypothetical protein
MAEMKTCGKRIRAAQHGVQVMPLARLQTWRVFGTRGVPSLISIYQCRQRHT